MKILLIDVDSKIPNLALMKLSAYYKSKGHEVGFCVSDPDKVYASVIFRKNKHLVDGLPFFYPNADIDIGGPGYDLSKKLPDKIEKMKPDYSLYPDIDYSIGFTTRGCFRKCHFCIVPEKEGKLKRTHHPKEWHNPEFDKIMFLDNNILGDRDWFLEITDWCIENNLNVWFTQGLDIRLLDVEIAEQLLKMRILKSIFFAWDHIGDEKTIKEKIAVLEQAGFSKSKLKSRVQFYVYVDSDQEYESGVYRCRELKKQNCNPFVMFNVDHKKSKRIKELQRWANRKWAFWSCDIADYSRCVA
jgi:hypothetical protein